MIPKISVIVPVYNAEKYLTKCLDSLVHQTLKEIEIICIDDASTDKSVLLIQSYQKNYPFIQLVRQKKNQGQGVSRNTAISLATGKYLFFMDADDWIPLNTLEILYTTARQKQATVVRSDFSFFHEDTGEIVPFTFEKLLWETYHYDLIKKGYYQKENFSFDLFTQIKWMATTYLFKTDFIKKNHICFSKTRLGEDHLFIISTHLLADKIYFVPNSLYFYRRTKRSMTRQTTKAVFDMFQNIKDVHCFLGKHQLMRPFQDHFELYKATALHSVLRQVPKKYKREFLKESYALIDPKYDSYLAEPPTPKRWYHFFFQKKHTRTGNIIIKICHIPVFYKKAPSLRETLTYPKIKKNHG